MQPSGMKNVASHKTNGRWYIEQWYMLMSALSLKSSEPGINFLFYFSKSITRRESKASECFGLPRK